MSGSKGNAGVSFRTGRSTPDGWGDDRSIFLCYRDDAGETVDIRIPLSIIAFIRSSKRVSCRERNAFRTYRSNHSLFLPLLKMFRSWQEHG